MSDFVTNGRKLLGKNAKKAIEDLLNVLDSEIKFPMLKDGKTVNETKLLAVVKSRNQVYNSAIKIMDEAEVDRSNDKKMKDSIVKSLKTTFNELNKIIIRDIRSELNWQELDETDEEISEVFKSIDLTDDYLLSISKSKEEAYLLNKQILENMWLQLLQSSLSRIKDSFYVTKYDLSNPLQPRPYLEKML